MDRAENAGMTAKKLFESGYNCAQAVLCTFAEELGMDTDTARRISSSFGGGMGRMREVCGACSGMFMAAGLKYGDYDVNNNAQKAQHYKHIQQLAEEFRKSNGSIICRELLGLSVKCDGYIPEKRTDEYYKKRPCGEMVADAARILRRYFDEHSQ